MKGFGWFLLICGIGSAIRFIMAVSTGYNPVGSITAAIGFIIIGAILIKRDNKKDEDKDKFENRQNEKQE